MDVDGYLSSQLVRKVLQYLTLINCLLIGPQKVKPFDDPLLQVLGHLVRNTHVVFRTVFILSLHSKTSNFGLRQTKKVPQTLRKLMYCLIASIRA